MTDLLHSRWLPLVLLTGSNVFMTFAWYGHLKFKHHPLWLVILASWGIAFFEYCLMVPANRWGHARYSAIELKIIQEVITLSGFSGFAIAYLGERVRWNQLVAFCCIIAAVAFTFLPAHTSSARTAGDSTAADAREYSLNSVAGAQVQLRVTAGTPPSDVSYAKSNETRSSPAPRGPGCVYLD